MIETLEFLKGVIKHMETGEGGAMLYSSFHLE